MTSKIRLSLRALAAALPLFGSVFLQAAAQAISPALTSNSTISNTSPKTNDLLSINTSYTTGDGSTPTGVTYTYAWKKNGGSTLSTAATYNLATAGRGDKGDTITCLVTPVKSGYASVANTVTAVVINTAPVVKDLNLYTRGNQKIFARPEFTDADNDTSMTGSATGVDGTITFAGTDGLFLWDPTTLNAVSGGTASATVTLSDGTNSTSVAATLHGDAVTGDPIFSAVGASDVQGKGATDYDNAKTDTSLANGYAPKIKAGLPARLGSYQLQRRAVNGFTTADALRSISGTTMVDLVNADAPGVITVWLGPNDALGLAYTLAVTPSGNRAAVVSAFDSTFTANYTSLLNSLRTGNAGATIVVGNVPPLGTLLATTGLLDADNISRLNNECLAMSNTIASLASSNSASVVDVNADTDADLDGNGSSESALTASDISSDHFHPNDSGYTKLANRFLSKIPDAIDPAVLISAPTANAHVVKSALVAGAINGTATDGIGVTEVDVQLTTDDAGTIMYWNGVDAFQANPVSVAATVTTAGGTAVTWSLDNVPAAGLLENQPYSVTAIAKDAAGNSSTPATVTFLVADEFNGPTVTISTPTAGQALLAGSLDGSGITGTATDDTSVASVSIKLVRITGGVKEYWDGTAYTTTPTALAATLTGGDWALPDFADPSALGTGSFSVVASAQDPFGNESAAVTRNFSIAAETVPPVASIASPAANQIILPATLTTGFINGGATDNSTVASISVKLFRTRAGVKSFWSGTAWVPASANATIDTGGLGTASATWSLNPVPTGGDVDTGAYSVQVVARDAAGNNSAAVSRSFTVSSDATAPVGTIANPTANQVLQPGVFAAMTVSGTGTDNVAVDSITVKLYRTISGVKEFWDGGSFGSTSVAAPITTGGLGTGSATWTLSPQPGEGVLTPGTYSLQLTVKDPTGNSTPVTRNFSLRDDATPPGVTITTPNPNQSLTATALVTAGIKGTAVDSSGVASVSVKLYRTIGGVKEYWNGAAFGSVSVSVPGTITSSSLRFGGSKIAFIVAPVNWSLSSMPSTGDLLAGPYGISVTAVDNAGNVSSPVTRNFTVSASTLRPSPSGKSF